MAYTISMKWILLAITLTGCNEATQGGGAVASSASSASSQQSAAEPSETSSFTHWWTDNGVSLDLRELSFDSTFDAKQGEGGAICNVRMTAEMRGDTLVIETTGVSVHWYPETHPELDATADALCAGGINGRYDLSVSGAGLQLCVEGTSDCTTLDNYWY